MKPLYAYSHQDVYKLARDALDSACLTVQHQLLNDSQNDFAEQFFTGENFNQVVSVLEKYIRAEINNQLFKG